MKNKNTFYEYGEISRNPIPAKTLINHYLKIHNGFRFKGCNDVYYINGTICVARFYHVKQFENEYISKIRFYRFEM